MHDVFLQHLSAKDQTKLTEPLKELDILLNQVLIQLILSPTFYQIQIYILFSFNPITWL